jgi:peptidyl-prolyl cis-trans isomerase C
MKNRSVGIRQQAVLLCVCFVFLFLTGCDKINFFGAKKNTKSSAGIALPVKGTVIAKVNNIPFTLEELNEEVETYNRMLPPDKPEAKITTREQKISYLKEEVIRRLLLYNEALNRGLERNEEALAMLEKNKRDILVLQLIKEITQNVKADAAEIEQYYNTYKDQLKEDEERRIREIVVSSEQEANNILIQLLQGADFATLAIEKSKASSSKNAGDLGYIKKGVKFAQFDSVAFAEGLEPGKCSNVFKGPEGYYIVKLEAKRGGQTRSLKDIWSQIEQGLTFLKQRQKVDELVDRLKTDPKFKVETFEGPIK